MVSYRPKGVTVLALFIIVTYSIIFVAGLALLLGAYEMPYFGVEAAAIGIVGFVFLIWALVRLSMGFGLLRMRKKAWRAAMVVFGIGLVIDILVRPPQAVLDVIIIVYLLIVKRHFVYGR